MTEEKIVSRKNHFSNGRYVWNDFNMGDLPSIWKKETNIKRDEKKETLVFSDSMCLCSCSCSTRMPCVELLFLQYLAVSGLCDEEIFCASVCVCPAKRWICATSVLCYCYFCFYRSFFSCATVRSFMSRNFLVLILVFFLLSFLIPPERLNVAVVYFSIVEFLCFNFFISL